MEYPNAEQVAVAWLRAVFTGSNLVRNFSSNKVGAVATWDAPVFALAQVASTGLVDVYAPEYNPIIRVSFLAAPGLFGQCFAAAERARMATYDGTGLDTFTVKDDFYPVRLTDVSIFSDSQPVRTDPADLARVQINIQLTYVLAEETVSP